jgi:hypothetical protein
MNWFDFRREYLQADSNRTSRRLLNLFETDRNNSSVDTLIGAFDTRELPFWRFECIGTPFECVVTELFSKNRRRIRSDKESKNNFRPKYTGSSRCCICVPIRKGLTSNYLRINALSSIRAGRPTKVILSSTNSFPNSRRVIADSIDLIFTHDAVEFVGMLCTNVHSSGVFGCPMPVHRQESTSDTNENAFR